MHVSDSINWLINNFGILQNSAKKIVKFFHCFQDDVMINVTLKLLTYNKIRQYQEKEDLGIYKYITIRDIINVFCSFVTKHAKNNDTLETILMQFSDIKPR